MANNLLSVTHTDIEDLESDSLTCLMFKLIYLEAKKYNIESPQVSGSENINIADGGKDAGIIWEGYPERTKWLPTKNCLFQNKATDFYPSDCYKEVFQNLSTKTLKPMLKDVGKDGKHYIIFNNRSVSDTTKRKEEIIRGFNDGGNKDVTKNDISYYCSSKIAKWTNEHISAIVFVKECLGKNISCNFRTWNNWSLQDKHKLAYFEDNKRKKLRKFLQNALQIQRSVYRFVGLSGLGKTRLVFEAFKPPSEHNPDTVQEALNNSVVYLDCETSDLPTLFTDVSMLINSDKAGILILDNCSSGSHNKLVDEITRYDSKLSMISIDNDPSEQGDNTIMLEKLQDDVIKEIVLAEFENLRDKPNVVDLIVNFSGGFPKIASLLADSINKKEPNIGSLTEIDLVNKLIGIKLDIRDKDCRILCSLSVFDHIGTEKDVEFQLEFIANNVAKKDYDDVRACIHTFKNRKIIDQRGKYIQISPRPLAIRLAEEWWKVCSYSKAEKLFTDDNLPLGMLKSLCTQFRYLDYVQEVRELANKLCESHAPFGQAEVLFSKRGSMVFRYLVEVSPQATVDAIYRVIFSTDLEVLKQIEGRRNIVVALEMLCYRHDCFYKAANCLMRLALAENESYSNNATGQFVQLFQIYLSGANATYNERLILIDNLLDSNDSETTILAIKALKKVIYYGRFIRDYGAELQGSKLELKEWKPKLWDEIFEYIRGGLGSLASLADYSSEAEILVKQAFENALSGLLRLGLHSEIKSFIQDVLSTTKNPWTTLQQALIRLKRYDSIRLNPENIECIDDCLDILAPRLIEDQIQTIICTPPYEFEEVNSTYTDISEQKAMELLAELIEDERIFDHLDLLLKGEQKYGLKVGLLIAEKSDNKIALFNKLIKHAKNIDQNEINLSVIAGFFVHLKEHDKSQYDELVQSLYSDNIMRIYLFDIIRMQEIDTDDLGVIVQLLESDSVTPNQFRILSYGSVLENCNPKSIQKLLTRAISVDSGFVFPSIDIMAMYLHSDKDDLLLDSLSSFVQKLLMKTKFLDYINKDSMTLYHRKILIKKIIKTKKPESEFLAFILQDIFNTSAETKFISSFDSDIRSLLFTLIEYQYKDVWDNISSFLLSSEKGSSNLLYWLNPKNMIGGSEGFDSILSEEQIIEWCKKEEKAREIIPSLINVIDMRKDSIHFHPLIYKMFDLGLYSQETLNCLFHNMLPRAWVGSAIPIYENCIKALNSLSDYKDPLITRWVMLSTDALKENIKFAKDRENDHYFKYHR